MEISNYKKLFYSSHRNLDIEMLDKILAYVYDECNITGIEIYSKYKQIFQKELSIMQPINEIIFTLLTLIAKVHLDKLRDKVDNMLNTIDIIKENQDYDIDDNCLVSKLTILDHDIDFNFSVGDNTNLMLNNLVQGEF